KEIRYKTLPIHVLVIIVVNLFGRERKREPNLNGGLENDFVYPLTCSLLIFDLGKDDHQF
ncbi:hypothetical protein ACJX0J_005509, partial [Zea mays]